MLPSRYIIVRCTSGGEKRTSVHRETLNAYHVWSVVKSKKPIWAIFLRLYWTNKPCCATVEYYGKML